MRSPSARKPGLCGCRAGSPRQLPCAVTRSLPINSSIAGLPIVGNFTTFDRRNPRGSTKSLADAAGNAAVVGGVRQYVAECAVVASPSAASVRGTAAESKAASAVPAARWSFIPGGPSDLARIIVTAIKTADAANKMPPYDAE
jgi:hypothetical protein